MGLNNHGNYSLNGILYIDNNFKPIPKNSESNAYVNI
jgi:hypothetical protein